MAIYQVLHLDHKHREQAALIKETVIPFRTLDMSIVDEYIITKEARLNVTEHAPKTQYSDYMKAKCEMVKLLLEYEVYEHVANVNALDHSQAHVKTNSINSLWYNKPAKGIEIVGNPFRDTTSYDLLINDEERLLVLPLGFLDIDKAAYLQFVQNNRKYTKTYG